MSTNTRPTPETDEEERIDNGDTHPILEFCRKLERERDEAREENKAFEALAHSLGGVLAKRDAMLEAMVETHKLLLSIQLNDIFEDTMRNHACLAIEKLKPFLP